MTKVEDLDDYGIRFENILQICKKKKFLEKKYEGLTQEETTNLIELERSVALDEARPNITKNFLSFVKYVWPEFIEGSHHKIINKKFNDLAEGKIKRLIINMPPRHTKSEFASYLLPAWMIGKNTKTKNYSSYSHSRPCY